ncbi:C-terminal binding protein [Microbacterium sp. CFH 90308]|uniref:C-terminal binding protein n=1 Tax=Microbacterium salsuginis TaxID=2722803 RepID=A0ABX1KGD9_9MICO|nr:C-terminal binding protein [Microbacterium sp. CFH 90308]NLP85155.1 C-terminal binding protein [Microbacterium sp. CFH 90308]
MATIVITDIAWPSPAIETGLAHAARHEILLAESDEHLLALAPQADAILTCFRRVPGEVLDAAERCLTVARYGVGVDNIDVARATDLGILVSNVPEFCTEEVADHTLALTLATLRNLVPAVDATRGGGWMPQTQSPPRRLRGLVFGVIGFGATGRAVAERAAAFGFEVVVSSRALAAEPAAVPPTVARVLDRDDLLRVADVVSLHVPLNAQTRHLIGAGQLAQMKDGALLINVGRGGLVDTEALRPELESGRLRVALDVTDPEPLPADHWLRSSPAAIVTPHVAFASDGSLVELATKATSNALAVLAGRRPSSIVNPEVLTSGISRSNPQ